MIAAAQTRYLETAREFCRRLLEQAAEAVEAVVLYGSVARGEATEDSDIDVMVLTAGDAQELEGRARALADAMRHESGGDVWLQVIAEAVDDFQQQVEMGYPLERTVARKGLVLFDRGAFAPIRAALPPLIAEEKAPYRPSRDLLDGHLRTAAEALAEARLLLTRDFWDGVSNRAYYAMFNAASAAVLASGVEEIRSHKALVALFRDKVALGAEYAADLEAAFNLRLDADYKPRFRVSEEAARDVVAKAERFIARVRAFVGDLSTDS
ncbi:MAG: HEPN domain-containing protein [Dehalococcoidia bacterium]|nr:HEPN domain-containing protein [Dehalococcoidia bacterium]